MERGKGWETRRRTGTRRSDLEAAGRSCAHIPLSPALLAILRTTQTAFPSRKYKRNHTQHTHYKHNFWPVAIKWLIRVDPYRNLE